MFSDTVLGNTLLKDQVYIDGVATASTGTGASGVFVVGSYTSGKVTADVNSSCTLTDVDKLQLLLDYYQGIAYLDSNFDIDEVNAANALSTTGGIYVGTGGESLNNVIEQLLINIGGWLIQKGDIFTIRIFDKNKASVRSIEYDELADKPKWYFDEEQFVSSVTTGYHKDEAEKEYRVIYDDSLEADAIADQYRLNNKVIETTLTSDTEAAEIGLRYYERFYEIPRTIEINVLSDISELFPSDVVTFELKRMNAEIKTLVPYSTEALLDETDDPLVTEDGDALHVFSDYRYMTTYGEKAIAENANYMITDIDKINKSITMQYLKDA
jgi:hypothetical protein